MANIDRFDADKYMDSDDLPELSLAVKMVWHITRGTTVDQAPRACGISLKFGQAIVARPLTQAAIRRVRSKAVKLRGPSLSPRRMNWSGPNAAPARHCNERPSELRNGRLPMGPARAGRNNRAVDWKTTRLIQAMVVGIAEPIEDNVCGLIPAGKPLSFREAARAIAMSVRRARALQQEPAFQSALKTAVEAYRACEEPAMAASIRDDRLARSRDRLNAIETIRGPRPVPGVTVNVQQNNGSPAPAGYVVDLTPKEHKPAVEAKTISATSARANVGDVARDAEQERAEAHRFRPR
jgi:hypothetical protein